VKGAAILAALGLALAAPAVAHAERLTVAVSTPQVQITSNFSGVAVTTFGVIEGAEDASLQGGYQVAVVVVGPPHSVVERRKDRILGIWANSGAATIIGAPSFYALDTSAPLANIAPQATLLRLGLGFDNLGLSYAGDAPPTPEQTDFTAAFVRLQEQSRLFTQGIGVQFIGDTIFRSTAFLPANIPDGRYEVLAYLFAGHTLVAAGQSSFTVSKTGFEQAIAGFAGGQALIYGLMTVALSVFIGWLGGVIFRRD
jgi:uncharacterized protein (TIGR02186 family)